MIDSLEVWTSPNSSWVFVWINIVWISARSTTMYCIERNVPKSLIHTILARKYISFWVRTLTHTRYWQWSLYHDEFPRRPYPTTHVSDLKTSKAWYKRRQVTFTGNACPRECDLKSWGTDLAFIHLNRIQAQDSALGLGKENPAKATVSHKTLCYWSMNPLFGIRVFILDSPYCAGLYLYDDSIIL